jgi:hypothetical protein
MRKILISSPIFRFCFWFKSPEHVFRYFIEFAPGKLRKTHSELLIQGKNSKNGGVGGEGRVPGREENFRVNALFVSYNHFNQPNRFLTYFIRLKVLFGLLLKFENYFCHLWISSRAL